MDSLTVLAPHGQHLAELEVGDRDGVASAAGRRVLHAGEPDGEVAAFYGLVDGGPLDLEEPSGAAPAEPTGDALRHLHVEAAHLGGIGRVGFNERGSTFGVAAPHEQRRSLALGGEARQEAHNEPGYAERA